MFGTIVVSCMSTAIVNEIITVLRGYTGEHRRRTQDVDE